MKKLMILILGMSGKRSSQSFFSYLKTGGLKYTELQICLLFYMGAKLGHSNCENSETKKDTSAQEAGTISRLEQTA
jgi:hypothetical protein